LETDVVQPLAGSDALRAPHISTAKLEAMVFVPIFDIPAEFGARLFWEREKWGGYIRRLGLKGD